MNSFYDVFMKNLYILDGAMQRHAPLIPHDLCEILKKHGAFLDKIPDNNKQLIVENMTFLLIRYASSREFYEGRIIANQDLGIADKEDHDKYMNIQNELSNKIKNDLKKAKSFRNTLSSFNENYAFVSDHQYNLLKGIGVDKESRYILVTLLDEHIERLKNKDLEVDEELKYKNMYTKPNLAKLKQYLKDVVNSYSIDGLTVRASDKLIKQIFNS